MLISCLRAGLIGVVSGWRGFRYSCEGGSSKSVCELLEMWFLAMIEPVLVAVCFFLGIKGINRVPSSIKTQQ